jgi:hypothetical protein
MVQSTTNEKNIIILTLIFIVIAGLYSILPTIMTPTTTNEDITHSHNIISLYNPKITRVEIIPHLDFYFYYVEIWSFQHESIFYRKLFLSANAESQFSINIYDRSGIIQWSKSNITSVRNTIKLSEAGMYTIKIHNPNNKNIEILISFELRN